MAYQEKEIEKLYYSIGEVADMMEVNASLLRYWEKEFPLLRPRKNSKGDRLFTKSDIEKIKLIHHLVKEKGYTLDGAKLQLKNNYEAEEKKLHLIEKLQKLKAFLQDLREELNRTGKA